MRSEFILSGIILASVAFSPAVAEMRKPIRPNIVVLLADDLGYGDLSSYGHPSIETPVLDQLAAEGQRWTNFYAGAPVCSPSRGALMTGKLPVRTGLYGIKRGVFWPNALGGIPAGNQTIADVLKGVGYDTVMVGKWHLGDRPYALPTRHGFDSWLGTPYSNDIDWVVAHGFQGFGEEPPELQQKFLRAIADPKRKSADWDTALIRSYKESSKYVDETIERPAKQETLTRRYTEQAVSVIKAHAGGDRPFFLYVAYNMPHVPTFASDDFQGKSLGGPYGDAVQEIDWSAGEIRRALEEAGVAQKTLVVFASDNGYDPVDGGGSGGLLKGSKGTTFEGGLRVPGIFWWPGHIKPAVVHGIGSLMDVYATALSLAGVKPLAEDIDSVDLSPALEGSPSPRDVLEYYSTPGQLLGYRRGAWKVNFTENGVTLSNKVSLYNLEHDPAEAIDLSERNPSIVRDLITEAKKRDSAIPHAAPIFDQE